MFFNLKGGNQAHFKKADCRKVLSGGQAYRCGGNFWWHDVTWLASHRVPVSNTQIAEIQKFYFPPMSPPSTWPTGLAVTVCVDSSDGDAEGNYTTGGLQRVSPEEVCHALLFSVATAIKEKAPDDIMMKWKNVFLTVNMVFESIPPGEERYWRAQNLREEMVASGETVTRTVRQRIYDVAGFKMDKEKEAGQKITPEKIALMWHKKMKQLRRNS